MKVKICGITNLHDALLAESLGADFIGLIFHPASPRAVTPRTAKVITHALTTAKSIGVFVHHSPTEITTLVETIGLAGVQIYQPNTLQLAKKIVLNAIRVQNPQSLQPLHNNPDQYFLLDNYHQKFFGGTGNCFDWSVLPKNRDKIFLSGGICRSNLAAVRALKPYAIDVCSHLEKKPGIKDPSELTQFFNEVHT